MDSSNDSGNRMLAVVDEVGVVTVDNVNYTVKPQETKIRAKTNTGAVVLTMPNSAEAEGKDYTIVLGAGGNNCTFLWPDSPVGYALVDALDLDAIHDRVVLRFSMGYVFILNSVIAP